MGRAHRAPVLAVLTPGSEVRSPQRGFPQATFLGNRETEFRRSGFITNFSRVVGRAVLRREAEWRWSRGTFRATPDLPAPLQATRVQRRRTERRAAFSAVQRRCGPVLLPRGGAPCVFKAGGALALAPAWLRPLRVAEQWDTPRARGGGGPAGGVSRTGAGKEAARGKRRVRLPLGPRDPRAEAERPPERGDKAAGGEELAPPYPGAGRGGCVAGRRRRGLGPAKMDLARTIILLCSWAAGAGGEGWPDPLGPRGLGWDAAFRLRLSPFPSLGRRALSPGRRAAPPSAGPALLIPSRCSPCGWPGARAPLPARAPGGRGGRRLLSSLGRSPFPLPELPRFPRRSASSGLGGAVGRFPPVRLPPSASPWGAACRAGPCGVTDGGSGRALGTLCLALGRGKPCFWVLTQNGKFGPAPAVGASRRSGAVG